MAFDQETLNAIFAKTDGRCHICRKKVARKNYGSPNARGAWEVEHSRPRSKGGSNHLNNLYAACLPCNRSKGNGATRTARRRHGYNAAPYSKEDKITNAVTCGIVCAVIGGVVLGPFGVVAGAALGAEYGRSVEPG